MIELPYVEESVMNCEAVSIQYRNVTDRRTDGQTELLYQYGATAYCCGIVETAVLSLE